MNKFIRLLLSFLSVLLFFSCSNNLKSSSLVISFNLPNQKNQNVQRTATNQEDLNVAVTLYDVLTTENNLQNLEDFKIIETQTVPIVNNKALVQFDNVQIGINALITAQITQNDQTLYEGKSEVFTVFEGQNQVKIQLKKVSNSEPNENPKPSTDYVEGAYFVNGKTGNDGNDGLSVNTPKKNLTNVITSLKNSTENPTKTIYIDGTLTAESQGVTDSPKKPLVTINDSEFYEKNKITLIGINDATIDANNCGKFIATDQNFFMKMQNLNIKNGWTGSSNGGALWFYSSSLELDGCVITNCVCEYSGDDNQKYTGIYMSKDSILKMTNTTCENSVYLYSTKATIDDNCTIGTNNPEATDGFITLDTSTLTLNGKNIVIYKPIYVQNRSSSIQIGENYSSEKNIIIKLASSITTDYDNSNQYTLITNCDETKSNYFTIECEDSTKSATLGADGKITVM